MPVKFLRCLGFAVAGLATAAVAMTGVALSSANATEMLQRPSVVMPLIDPERGLQLFVSKGCVLCHAINDVGGKAAPALDAPEGSTIIDPLGFVSRMWRGASAMIELQSIELGYQIVLSADELADLAAFAANRSLQADFGENDIPEPMRYWTLDEPYWEGDEWPEELMEKGPIWD